jgi:proteasome lid subunit RPN8/RPN11
LLLPRPLYLEMIAQAQAELPNECCGLLAGKLVTTDQGLTGHVLARLPLVNALGRPDEYFSEPRSMLAAERRMRDEGLELLAVYHSHPSSDPVPSRKDRERNLYEDFQHLIISLKGKPAVRAWWIVGGDYREAECEVVDVSADVDDQVTRAPRPTASSPVEQQ